MLRILSEQGPEGQGRKDQEVEGMAPEVWAERGRKSLRIGAPSGRKWASRGQRTGWGHL